MSLRTGFWRSATLRWQSGFGGGGNGRVLVVTSPIARGLAGGVAKWLCMRASVLVVTGSILGVACIFVGDVKMGVLAKFTNWADFDGVVL